MLIVFVIKTHLGEHIQLPLKEESTPPKIIKMTETSIHRLFYDTVKGGDFRSREANVYRLAQVSTNIIDQCVAQGVPFAREYGGLLANRSFGGAQVSRTFYLAWSNWSAIIVRCIQCFESSDFHGAG